MLTIDQDLYCTLTIKEREFSILMRMGYTNEEIARYIGMTIYDAATMRAKIYRFRSISRKAQP